MNGTTLARAVEEIRYEKVGPVLGIIGSMILLGGAYFFWTEFGEEPVEKWDFLTGAFILVPGTMGVWFFCTRLIRLVDNTPQVIIGWDGLILRQYDPDGEIAWGRIYRAKLSRTTENGSETSAYLTVMFHDDIGIPRQATARVDRLTWASDAILGAIKLRSGLTDV